MCRYLAPRMFTVCGVLLTLGASGLADDAKEEVIFDLSEAFVFVESAPVPEPEEDELLDLIAFGDEPAVADEPADVAPLVEPANEQPLPLDEALPAAPVQEEGFSHWRRPSQSYPLPSRSFSIFQSPVSYGWSYFERCCPKPFAPRGKGIPERTSSYRMDYRPYVLENLESVHGPAFYQRFELYPCEECHWHRKHLQRYYGKDCR